MSTVARKYNKRQQNRIADSLLAYPISGVVGGRKSGGSERLGSRVATAATGPLAARATARSARCLAPVPSSCARRRRPTSRSPPRATAARPGCRPLTGGASLAGCVGVPHFLPEVCGGGLASTPPRVGGRKGGAQRHGLWGEVNIVVKSFRHTP